MANLTAPPLPDTDVEGLDPTTTGGWGDYPLDSVFVRTETRTVSEVVKRIQGNRYILDPEFQRDFVWPPPKQSKLIESCVMRIPLPVFYVAEAKDGRIIVVDGLQRLATFTRFLENHLRLEGLATSDEPHRSHPLEDKTFAELPLNLQERVQDTQLTMYILDAKAPERARLDIFERVNSGEPLTRQQMRNALYSGPATAWLKAAAESPEFRSATGQSLDSKKMRDREAINRFCAFKLFGWRAYKTGDMDTFLADSLIKLNSIQITERNTLFDSFIRSMRLNQNMFGLHAFRKSLASPDIGASRTILNISLFESCAVTFSELPEDVDVARLDDIKNGLIALIRDDSEFVRAITYSTNSTRPVAKRFGRMEELVNKVMYQ
jgi:Protein of unknown function DUF262